jgi:filamentous hemagglutinin
MMWLVKRTVGGQEVLVPHLYLTSVSPEKMAASKSAMAAGGNISLSAKSINNQSSMYAGNNLSLAADLLKNTSSLGAGGNLLLATRGDLQQDGRLFAQGDVRLLAAGAINNNGSVSSHNVIAVAQNMLSNSTAGSINAQQNVLLQSTQNNVVNNGSLSGSNVTFDAGQDVHLQGSLSVSNNLALIAKQDVVLHSEKTETDFNSKKIKSSSVQYTTTNLAAGGSITLDAGRDIQAEGSDFTAGGDINLRAGNDINLLALQNQSNYEYNAKRKKEIHNTTEHDVVNINSNGSVSIDAGRDANLTGTNIAANDDVYLSADRDTNITAVVDSDYDYSYSKKKKSFGRSKMSCPFVRDIYLPLKILNFQKIAKELQFAFKNNSRFRQKILLVINAHWLFVQITNDFFMKSVSVCGLHDPVTI